ncbi:MAG: radical SAM family heme chaperone HemW [Sphingomonadales bacterium]
MRPLALYVHWPFCESKCPYCDFNSHVRKHVDQTIWRDALLAELEDSARLTGPRRLVSIFFGGGTPSLMAPETVAALIERARALWPADDPVEITLEANPSSVEAGRFRALADAGVNRLSLGIQALDDAALGFLGRRHDSAAARAAIATAQRHFGRVSLDFIYALPGQSLADWRRALAEALAFGTEHLSLYQLTIEPGTAFYERHARGGFALPDEDLAADLFALTQDMTAAAGLPAYEISNHARPAAACRHNLVYWRGGDYAGIGPGGHGRLRLATGWHATETLAKPEAWAQAVARHGHGRHVLAPLAGTERAREILMMGLRLAQGLDLDAVSRASGVELDAVIDAAARHMLLADGLLAEQGGRLMVTPAGRPLTNSVLAALLAEGAE